MKEKDLQTKIWNNSQDQIPPMQVRDAAFLFRYNEPVLAILHETHPGWAGRARRGGKDNLALVAFSVNLSARRSAKTRLLGIAASQGGVVPITCAVLLMLRLCLSLWPRIHAGVSFLKACNSWPKLVWVELGGDDVTCLN